MGKSRAGFVDVAWQRAGTMRPRVENTFGGQLKHFAKSVDIVDDQVFNQVRSLIYKYVRSELGTAYFEVAREQDVDGQPGLRMFWSSRDRDHAWRLRADDGSCTNPITYSVAMDRPLWIVGTDKKPLVEAEKCEDLWSHATDLPIHQPAVEDQAIRMVVVVPLRRRRVLGAYYFESPSYIGITDVARKELMQLADALAILLELYESHTSQANLTADAINDLQETLESARFPKLTKPHFFAAFSNRADERVTMVIREVLDLYSDRLDSTDWTEMAESGNISAQIAREIIRSRFGVCYLSEPAANGAEHRYVDNPNVVFEAGMLHAVTSASASSDASEPSGWIPIREANSATAPFDFAAERTVEVPRGPGGELNEARLRNILENRVNKLLGEPPE